MCASPSDAINLATLDAGWWQKEHVDSGGAISHNAERRSSEAVKKLIAEIMDFTKRSRSFAGGAKICDRQKDSLRPPQNYYSPPTDVFLFLGHLDARV